MLRTTDTHLRIFLVDALVLMRDGLRNLLHGHEGMEVVGEAGTLAEARDRIPACRPDVVTLDLWLPDGDAVDLVESIAAGGSGAATLVVTAESTEERLYAAILAGANGVLHKNDAPTALIEALQRVAAGDLLVDGRLVARLVERVRSREPDVDPRLTALTPMERSVLELLVAGMRNREIAAAIHMSQSTVKNHVSSILRKLDASSRTEAALIGVSLFAGTPGGSPPEGGPSGARGGRE